MRQSELSVFHKINGVVSQDNGMEGGCRHKIAGASNDSLCFHCSIMKGHDRSITRIAKNTLYMWKNQDQLRT